MTIPGSPWLMGVLYNRPALDQASCWPEMALRPRLDRQVSAAGVDVDLGAGVAAAVAYDLLVADDRLGVLEVYQREIRQPLGDRLHNAEIDDPHLRAAVLDAHVQSSYIPERRLVAPRSQLCRSKVSRSSMRRVTPPSHRLVRRRI